MPLGQRAISFEDDFVLAAKLQQFFLVVINEGMEFNLVNSERLAKFA